MASAVLATACTSALRVDTCRSRLRGVHGLQRMPVCVPGERERARGDERGDDGQPTHQAPGGLYVGTIESAAVVAFAVGTAENPWVALM